MSQLPRSLHPLHFNRIVSTAFESIRAAAIDSRMSSARAMC